MTDSGASTLSWRLSPSSSGYKSQSQMSESVTPSPTSTPHPLGDTSRQDSAFSDAPDKGADSHIVWAVTDIQSVPKGSIIIDPQTGEPMKNDDGSLYHYDPTNPPPGYLLSSKPPPSPKKKSPQRKERSESPKKRSSKYSPQKSHVNTATSPSMPYSPPLQNRGFQFISGMGENIPPQQQFPGMYGGAGFVPPHQDGGISTVPMYQQPCIVYSTPYGVPVSPQFDGRMVIKYNRFTL